MHYSPKRSLAIASRLSVCPSLTLVDQDHICWKSWKIIARTISATPIHGGTWENLGENRGGWGKSGVVEHKGGNICETRTSIRKVTMDGLWELSNALSSSTIPTPYGLLFLGWGFATDPPPKKPKLQSLLSQEWVKLQCIWTSYLARTFTGSIRTKALKSPLKILEKRERGRTQGLS